MNDIEIKAGKNLINADNAVEDPSFAEALTKDFFKADPKGEDLVPHNPLVKEKGEDLAPLNPLVNEKGEDLGADFYEILVGEAASSSSNVRSYADDTPDFGKEK